MIHTSNRNSLYIGIVIAVTLILAAWLLLSDVNNHQTGHDDHAEEQETPKGPQGGRLLTQDNFAIEITIFETGIPPEFQVYAYADNKLLAPEEVNLTIELARLDGQIDLFKFKPQANYLRGDGVVTEPHSFDVIIKATYKGQSYQWQYENYEGRTDIARNMADEAGIKTSTAGPATIHEILTLTGRIQTDPNRMAHVRARFPGMVKSVKRDLGAVVRAGDVLATVQSNESLQTYSVKAPISGVIVHREIQTGEATSNEPLYIITDLSQLWIEFDLFGRDLNRVQIGQSVMVETLEGQQAIGKINWISPLATHTSQSVRVRVVISNPDGLFRPGQFVRGKITIVEHAVALAVQQSAIQGFRDFKVVFARINDTYEVRMLDLGRRDKNWVEVLSGLKPGTEYVSENSYLIKADIEKSGASHDH